MRTFWLICLFTIGLTSAIIAGRSIWISYKNVEPPIHLAQIVDGPDASPKPALIPFVGCPSDGQSGPVNPPKGKGRVIAMMPDAAKRLAYYSSEDNLGILAPRGWHCFGTYGSSGSSLYVSPQPIAAENLFAGDSPVFLGPLVVLTWESGGTSGRFGVAKEIARVFPAYRSFATKVINEGLGPEGSFPSEPYPSDKLRYVSDSVVEYQTPGFAEGLGTEPGLKEDADSITGVAIITGEDTDLIKLAARLPKSYSALTPVLVRQIEQDAALRTNPGNAPQALTGQPAESRVSEQNQSVDHAGSRSVEPRFNFSLGVLLVAVLLFFLYWLPTFVAYRRNTVNKGGVLIVNLFFGWTLIGWVVALAMAMGGSIDRVPAEPVVIYAQNIYGAEHHNSIGLARGKTIESLPSSDQRTEP